MKPPPPITLVPRRSHLGIALILSTHASTAVLVACLPMPWVFRVVAVAIVVLTGAFSVRALASGVPRSVRIGIARRIDITMRGGVTMAGVILDESYVGSRVTTIVWRPDGARRNRTLLVLPDTFPREDFRRLRVILRYSRASLAGTSDDEAG